MEWREARERERGREKPSEGQTSRILHGQTLGGGQLGRGTPAGTIMTVQVNRVWVRPSMLSGAPSTQRLKTPSLRRVDAPSR